MGSEASSKVTIRGLSSLPLNFRSSFPKLGHWAAHIRAGQAQDPHELKGTPGTFSGWHLDTATGAGRGPSCSSMAPG